MRKITFSMQRLRAMPRPRAYLDELAACAVQRTQTEMTFDVDGDCYRALKAKYAGYQPTSEDLRRARAHAPPPSRSRREALIRRQRAAKAAGPSRRRRGCGGCGGRSVKR